MRTNIICTFILFISIQSINAQNTLSGIIHDTENQNTLPGASIYFPDLKTGTVSDADGKYQLSNLPSSKTTVQITFIGYESQVTTIDLAQISKMDFQLKSSVTEIKEIVVTGLSRSAEANRTATPITVVTKAALLQNTSSNIIDALGTQPGISNISTGPAISKPEIRGLGYNRVVIVNDGIKQEGQQWGDEHGIEIDEYSVNRIEILKGPASLAYGSDAMAGVIHFISAPTLPNKSINGNFLTNYQSNNGLIGYSGNIAGNNNGLIWDARYSGKFAHAYQNKYDGFVFGSGFKEQSGNALIGLNKKWGYSHLQMSIYNLQVGLVEGERDSLTGQFIHPIAINDSTEETAIASQNELTSYNILLPRQNITHYKITLNNSFVLGDGSLQVILGWQQNNRQEFGDVLNPDDYGLYFKLNTLHYAFQYIFPEKNNWQTAVGINGIQQNSQNLGEEVLIPAYQLFDIGGFATTKKTVGKFDIAGGLRYDLRTLHGDGYLDEESETNIFTDFDRKFYAVTGSLGSTYQITKNMYSKLNVSRGFRAPNLADLGSNGVHEGTFRYEIGNLDLKPETSLQIDASFGYSGEHISFEADVFNNAIQNFIFLRKLNSAVGGDSLITSGDAAFQAFTYTQGQANLAGAEFILDIHPHAFHWLHFENSFSFVNAVQANATDSTKYLPFSPAPKLISELRGDFKEINGHLKNSYLQIQLENYFTQNHIYSAYETETATPGYSLLNFGAGTDITARDKVMCSIYLSVNNITDVAYQNHLSRLKYGEENYATGRSGVYNMGRNVSLKLNIPIMR